MLSILIELVRKDLRIFLADRRAMIISFAVPVFIACFLATLTGNMNGPTGKTSSKIAVAVVDEDKSEVTKNVLDELGKRDNIEVWPTDRATANLWVNEGRVASMYIFDKGFGEDALKGNRKPVYEYEADPSKTTEAGVTQGAVLPALFRGVAKAKFPGAAAMGLDDESPFEVKDLTPQKQDPNANWSGVAHSFAGMGVQGLLFWAIESAMVILRERKQGIWRRLRASPVSPAMLLLGKVLSGAIRALAVLIVVFGAGAGLFHMRVEGSFVGFVLVMVTASLMAATFGLFVAALGKTEQQSRGLSILAVLVMMMLGGAWFPSFMMPAWVQNVAKLMPVKWAVDGFDAMMWRAQDLSHAMPFVCALLCFSAVFSVIALRRMRWEIEA